jgi:hypothetical protein
MNRQQQLVVKKTERTNAIIQAAKATLAAAFEINMHKHYAAKHYEAFLQAEVKIKKQKSKMKELKKQLAACLNKTSASEIMRLATDNADLKSKNADLDAQSNIWKLYDSASLDQLWSMPV